MDMQNQFDDHIKELSDKLNQGVKALVDGDQYKKYLNTMAKFTNYSANNCILIGLQKPDATYVAGYSDWKKKFNRQVRKGEKAIKIFAPAPYRTQKLVDRTDLNGKPVYNSEGKPVQDSVEVIVPAFKAISVFDISQTDGEELPSIIKELEGTTDNYERLFTALQTISPVPIEFENIQSGANGYYSLAEKRIAIRDGMSDLQNIKTAIHEISHAILHDRETGLTKEDMPDSRTKEIQAESCAYIVCQHFNIDTSDYSFGYIAGWAKDKELSELKNNMSIIRSTSAKMINDVELQIDKMIDKENIYKLATIIDSVYRDYNLYNPDEERICQPALIDSLITDINRGDVETIQKRLESAVNKVVDKEIADAISALKDKVSKYSIPSISVTNSISTMTERHVAIAR